LAETAAAGEVNCQRRREVGLKLELELEKGTTTFAAQMWRR
jgi:hypothetical protein